MQSGADSVYKYAFCMNKYVVFLNYSILQYYNVIGKEEEWACITI